MDFIQGWEACRLEAYQDQGGVWTVGYGATGPEITASTVWSQRQADIAFLGHLDVLAVQCTKLVTVPTTLNQENALISLCYNIGIGDFKKSALLRFLNQSNYSSAANQFLMWTRVGVYVSNGLVRRREAERNLFLKTE